ncbi:MAG: hypothetical protein JWN63_720 [Candidatus Acidoferrum typicum]|nr:hypothetical protein [Candidatus Acidoferrum typicum]
MAEGYSRTRMEITPAMLWIPHLPDFWPTTDRLELKRQGTNSDLRERSCSAAPLEGCGSALGSAHDFAATLLRTNNRSCHSSLEFDSVFLGL